MLPLYINSLIALLSFGTATGIFIHDMHLDKAAVAAFSTPAATPNYDGNGTKNINLTPDLHTHTERHSLAQMVHDLRATQPQIQPRSEDKKHLLQKHAAKGHHAFDNYNLPLI